MCNALNIKSGHQECPNAIQNGCHGYLVTDESLSSKTSSSSRAMFSLTTMTPDPCGNDWAQDRRKLTRSSAQ